MADEDSLSLFHGKEGGEREFGKLSKNGIEEEGGDGKVRLPPTLP
jgi:hypothetical protein